MIVNVSVHPRALWLKYVLVVVGIKNAAEAVVGRHNFKQSETFRLDTHEGAVYQHVLAAWH
jgi:hypothetical protein